MSGKWTDVGLPVVTPVASFAARWDVGADLPLYREGGNAMGLKTRRIGATLMAVGAMAAIAAPVAAAAPGAGSKPQCAGGKFPGANGNPHCPQNK
jgi:hypothetical protein